MYHSNLLEISVSNSANYTYNFILFFARALIKVFGIFLYV